MIYRPANTQPTPRAGGPIPWHLPIHVREAKMKIDRFRTFQCQLCTSEGMRHRTKPIQTMGFWCCIMQIACIRRRRGLQDVLTSQISKYERLKSISGRKRSLCVPNFAFSSLARARTKDFGRFWLVCACFGQLMLLSGASGT